ncbi:MAG: tRNA uridine-5-carboxymethylaminomethyl(34) synthesis enzyme MnmG, partial [Pediococcus pentosaceus]|nr:tRNA uridine-5-carboxymethylaminomethyl(34) synthesis enzyme MnmG [Pediococcus pentosaceus]MCI1472516.1 tRNA uridine-5-carboxymethylaminomethyl(34) synthesis enzyme MnmG [Pediococcus pentosaceus]
KPSQVQEFLESKGSNGLKDGVLASEFLRRPEVNYSDLLKFIDAPEKDLDRRVIEQVEIETKYAGYIKKAQDRVDRLKRMEEKAIPDRIDYEAINGLATEGRQKLEKIRPTTIAQASRISGVTPADIAILSVYIQQGKIAKIAE